ncbi:MULTISPECIES: hypothetical protein [Paenibacillus]|uniref:hypothetical protein n=1 Tax=Paenibacillus TaxID=44249 RepID=UPI0011A2D0E7|nr:hypothetical protein [Paenibacillus sp. IHBB 10380]
MDGGKPRFPSFPPPAPAGSSKQVAIDSNHSTESVQTREMQIGKTMYIVQSCYNGQDTFIDKIRRLVLRTWEEEQHMGK